MTIRALQNSFVSGEIAPQLIGRTDDGGYRAGAYKLENFVVLPQGAIRSRSGFQYVAKAKDSTKSLRLIPFRFASNQTLVLVFGDKTMRIVTEGKEVLNSDGSVYEVTTPYTANDLNELNYSQNADIITFTSHSQPPYELIRYGATDWRFRLVTVSPTIQPPQNLGVTPIYASRLSEEEDKDKNKLEVKYVVTAVDERGYESVASRIVVGNGNFYINGCKIRVSWSAVANANRYRVYRYVSGIYGYVGQTPELYLDDVGDNPDASETPPQYKEVFSGSTSGIQAINVLTAGEGYTYDETSLLPDFINLSLIPPIMAEQAVNNLTGVFLDIYSYGTLVKSISLPFVVSSSGETSSSGGIGAIFKKRINIYVLKDSGTSRRIYLNTNIKATGVVFKVRFTSALIKTHFIGKTELREAPNIYIGMSSQTSGDGSETTTKETYISDAHAWNLVNTDYSQFYGDGYSLSEIMELFGNDGLEIKNKLTITSNTGKDAEAYALVQSGRVTSVDLTSHGSNYNDATVTLQSSTGSGATFQPILSSAVLPDLPSSVTQYDQRRVFAGSEKNPLRVWFTNAGFQDLMQYHQPTLSDDRIIIDAVASDADRIRHLVALDSLLIFTGSSELRVYTQNSDSLSPTSVAVRAQSYIGSSFAQPVILNNQVLFAGSRGGHIYAMGYQNSAGSYVASDISLRATHLFDGHDIKSLALSKAPLQELWAVTDEGYLLGCTLYTDQSVIAWHKHTTAGIFEDVCVVSEGQEDHLYVVVKRDGERFIERMEDLTPSNDPVKWKNLDCYAEGTFATPTKTVTGLGYLEGKTVGVFVDGKTQSQKVVTNGQITLDTAGKNIVVGLPYTSTLVTLPLIAQAEASLQGRVKNISEVFLRVSYDGDLYANNLYANSLYKINKDDIYMKPHGNKGYVVKVSTDGNWDYDAQLKIEHRDYAPIEIEAVIANYSTEGER